MKIYVSKKRDPLENFIPGPGRNNGFPLHPGNLRCNQSVPVHSLVGHRGSRSILVGWTRTYGRLLSRTKRWLLNPGKSTVLLASSRYSIINQKNTLCMPGIYYFQFYFSLLILIVFPLSGYSPAWLCPATCSTCSACQRPRASLSYRSSRSSLVQKKKPKNAYLS